LKENKLVRKNCWEVKKCGRQSGGEKVEEFGVCPAAIHSQNDGKNGGEHSGRFCWAVAGTLCNGEVQGIFAMKITDCLYCDFLKQVHEEEGQNFVLTLFYKSRNLNTSGTGKNNI
jgi:hypothetical protein